MPGEYLNDPAGYKKIVDDCKALDCDMLRIGMLPMTCMGSYEKGHRLVSVKMGHLGRGDGGHLNADQTFIRHGNTLLIVSFYAL